LIFSTRSVNNVPYLLALFWK